MTVELNAETIDFSKLIKPGDTVVWTQGAGEPLTLIEKLLEQRHAIGPFRVFLGASYTGMLGVEHTDVISLLGMGAVGSNRELIKAGKMEIIPCHLTDVPRLLSEGRIPIDVVFMQLSPENEEGNFSLGAVNGYVQAALQRARVVIGEVNDQAPWTYARHPVDSKRFDYLVRMSRPLVEVPARSFGDIDRVIAANIASFVPDGATLQIGIGTIPNAVFNALTHHRNLGLHTGVIGDGVIDLLESGVLNNACKPIDAGISVTGGLVGTRRIYDYAHRNPSLRVDPVSYTHMPGTLAMLNNFIAINSAIEVDLTGQVGSEMAGRSYIGTVGGQIDFVRGAFASPGGRAIIGLPSRTERGKPRIVSRIALNTVTAARSDADVIITEYGSAELRGIPLRERVRRMIAIAHPDDREQLEREAYDSVGGY
jgi:acetyl-CoA hydrolase